MPAFGAEPLTYVTSQGMFTYEVADCCLGVGMSKMALQRTHTPPVESIYYPAFMVRGSMSPTGPAFNLNGMMNVPIAVLTGNGLVQPQGQFIHQGLSKARGS